MISKDKLHPFLGKYVHINTGGSTVGSEEI